MEHDSLSNNSLAEEADTSDSNVQNSNAISNGDKVSIVRIRNENSTTGHSDYLEDHSSRYRQPTAAVAPPPPPAMPPGGFNTARPDFNRGQVAHGYGAGYQQQPQQHYGGYHEDADQSAMQPGNFSTTPAGGRRPSGARNQGT